MPMNYAQHPGQGSYYPPSQQQFGSYGNVSYAVNPAGNHSSNEANTKQALESIRNMVLDTQRGTFDTRSYSQVASRLSALPVGQLPFLASPSMADYQPAPSGESPQGAVYGPTAQYSLPSVPNLRTKEELIDADHIFQNIQTTIYENSVNAAAAGVAQPDVHRVQTMSQRQSNSPPGLRLASSHNTGVSYSQNLDRSSPPSNYSRTPDLTPPSSSASFASGNSPPSIHDNNSGVSPVTPGVMYPMLPGGSTDSYPISNLAPTSTLASQFDQGQRRRYSGGRLQKARPLNHAPKRDDEMETSEEGNTTPRNAISSSSSEAEMASKIQTRRNLEFSSSNLDPALGGIASPLSGEMDEGTIKANEMWVGHARTIEALRTWIKYRLDEHEYVSDEEGSVSIKTEPASLYPVLAAI